MKRAFVSDIHGNYAAWRAVAADIDAQGVDETLCLGDTVGYGPQPCDCLTLVRRRCGIVLLGNHDMAAVNPAKAGSFVSYAAKAIDWTRAQLLADSSTDHVGYLQGLKPSYRKGDLLFVHGSPRDPLEEYAFPEDVFNRPAKIEDIFAHFDHLAFNGHTHVPGIFVEEQRGYTFIRQKLVPKGYKLEPGQKALINVGSVGQPRDGDTTACYLIFEDDQLTYRRVPYDVQETAKLIRGIPELADKLADRLEKGA